MKRSVAPTALVLAMATTVFAQTDVLPDITTDPVNLADNNVQTSGGVTTLYLANGTPNLGPGRLELRGTTTYVVINGETKQLVNQRVYRTDGSFYDRAAGYFTYHPTHSHIHYDNWCQYRIREILPGDGVGAILRSGSKISFCVLDLQVYDSSLPGYRSPGYYAGCGNQIQGLTPGWKDVYGSSLPGQSINITGLPDGDYWLESEIDPDNNLLEANEANNASRIRVHIGAPVPPVPDAYEPNDSITQVNGRPEGAANSPNLGTVNALRTINNLSITTSNSDWFRFRLNATGNAGSFLKMISSTNSSQGDIDLELYNSAGTRLASSTSSSNNETISLSGRPAGYYYARTFPYRGVNPNYTLQIQPAGNGAPGITIMTPPASGVWVERGFQTFPVTWAATDPENDPMTVSIYRSRRPVFDKNAELLPAYGGIPAEPGIVNYLTGVHPLGTFFLWIKVSDGAAETVARAPGTFTLYIRGDLNWDGEVDRLDVELYKRAIRQGQWISSWDKILDMDLSGTLDPADIDAFFDRAKMGHSH